MRQTTMRFGLLLLASVLGSTAAFADVKPRKEIRHDRREVRHDRRELRQDHRELRGDKRELRRDFRHQ